MYKVYFENRFDERIFLDEVKSEIVEFISANKSNMSVVKPVLEICRENGCGNPTEIDNIEVAEKVLAACKK